MKFFEYIVSVYNGMFPIIVFKDECHFLIGRQRWIEAVHHDAEASLYQNVIGKTEGISSEYFRINFLKEWLY